MEKWRMRSGCSLGVLFEILKPLDMTTKKNVFRIAVIDDHPILRQGIVRLINEQPDFEVVGETDEAKKATSLIQQCKPDGVVLDVSLKGSSGIEAAKDIKSVFPKVKILMLSMHDENIYASRALKAGASGYIMKQETPELVLAALRKVMTGQVSISERYSSRLLSNFANRRGDIATSPVDLLSDRELEVFTLIGKGFGTRPIAERLNLSVKTIESHRAHIKEKMNLESATELVHYAIQWEQGANMAIPAVAA
jgi:DNA-binding NarL/FixJ family response regulator